MDNNNSMVPDVSNIVLPVPGAGEAAPSYIMPEVNNPTAIEETTSTVEAPKNILPGTPGIELLSTSSLLNNGEVPVTQTVQSPVTQEVQTPVTQTVQAPTNTEVEVLNETLNLTSLGVGNTPIEETVQEVAAPLIDPTLPNSNAIKMDSMDPNIRYNPVTGEEMNVEEVIQSTMKTPVEEAPPEENKKKGEIGKKIRSTWNSLLLILLFVFLVIFVVFLPEVQTTVSNFFEGKKVDYVEVIPTGQLVCTMDANTTTLDRHIERVFQYENNKVRSSKFTTVVRGDITLDEEELDQLNEQCNKVKEKVSNLEGVSVYCDYENGRLEERESFDYKNYSLDDVSTAYLDAGSSLVEIEYQEDIDHIMTLMRQGGFTCNKEK